MLILIALGMLLVIQLAIGLLIFFESQRTKKIELRVFALLTLSVLLWTIFNIIISYVGTKGNTHNEIYFVRANQIAFALACTTVLLIYIFSLVYPIKRPIKLRQKIVIFFGLVLACLSPLKLVSGSFSSLNNKLTYNYGSASVVIILFVLIVVAVLISQNVSVIRSKAEDKLKKQSTTLITGFALTVVHAILFIIILPILIGQKDLIYDIGYAAPFYLVVFTGYGLLRQGLFDVRLIVARSVAYVFTLAAIGLIFIAPTLIITNSLLRTPLSIVTILLLVAVTLIAAILFQPLRKNFNRVSSKLFYRDYYEIQDVLDQLGNLLVASVNPSEIEKKSINILSAALKPVTIEYLIIGEDITQEENNLIKTLRHNSSNIMVTDNLDAVNNSNIYRSLTDRNTAITVRLRTKDGDLGFILLGYKRSGQTYSDTDVRLLTIAADEIAISLQNALRFEEIEQFNITLQQKVDEATLKLRRANDKLRALDETKDDFISMASHQLRTPLTSVKGYLSMVLEGDAGKITKAQKDMLGQAFFSSQRMVYLIADLLNVSRLKTGKFVIEPSPVNLAEIVKQELSQLGETASSKNLTLTYDKPKDFPTLMLDETKTRQVIMNFVDNAVYYTPAGGEIKVRLIDNPSSVELRVEDNGIGVPKAEQHHLFTKFYRAGNARKARPDGTGLGLFMAKKVVLAEGGSIIFESQEGKGSTFGFVFPKAKLRPKTVDNIPVKESAESTKELAAV